MKKLYVPNVPDVSARLKKQFSRLFVVPCSCKISSFYLSLPQFVHIIKRTLRFGLKIWILFSRVKNILTHSLRSLVKYCFHHSKIKFLSSRHRVISSINDYHDKWYVMRTWDSQLAALFHVSILISYGIRYMYWTESPLQLFGRFFETISPFE